MLIDSTVELVVISAKLSCVFNQLIFFSCCRSCVETVLPHFLLVYVFLNIVVPMINCSDAFFIRYLYLTSLCKSFFFVKVILLLGNSTEFKDLFTP